MNWSAGVSSWIYTDALSNFAWRCDKLSLCVWQSTYENFRYRYDRRANPYNKGVIENFKEMFCTSIPASKNNFRAKVSKEPETPSRTVGAGYVSPGLGKDRPEIEMGRKPVWEEAAGEAAEYAGQLRNADGVDKDEECTTTSPYSSRAHPRPSGWSSASESWNLSTEVLAVAAEVGGSKRVSSGDANSLTKPTARTNSSPQTSQSLNLTL